MPQKCGRVTPSAERIAILQAIAGTGACHNWQGTEGHKPPYGCEESFPVNASAGQIQLKFNTTSGPAIKNLLSKLSLTGDISLTSVGTYDGYDWIALLNNWVDTTFLPEGTLTTDPLTHSGTISLQSIINNIANLLSQDEKYNGNLANNTYDSDKALVIGNATLSEGRVY